MILPLLVVIAGLALGGPSLYYPFGRDQGLYAFEGQALLEGQALYRDVHEIKPPMAAVMYVPVLLFTRTMAGIRILDLIWTVATALLLALLVLRMFRSPEVAVAAGMFYPFHYYLFGFWHTAQADGWLNLFVVAALLQVWPLLEASRTSNSTGHGRRAVLAGICVGIATLYKLTVLALAPLLLLLFSVRYRQRLKTGLTLCLTLMLGLLVPLALFVLVLAVSRSLHAYVEVLYLLRNYSQPGSGHSAVEPGAAFLRFFPHHFVLGEYLAVLGVVLFIVAWARTRVTRAPAPTLRPSGTHLALLLVMLIGPLVSTVWQGKYFVYHYLPLLPLLALLDALALVWLLEALARRLHLTWSRVVVTGFAIVAIVAASSYPAQWQTAARLVTGAASLKEYWQEPQFSRQFSLTDNLALSEWLKTSTTPEAKVYVWGFEPMVNYLAQRATVSRFSYSWPLIGEWDSRRARAELLDALSRAPPEVFVVEHGDRMPWVTGNYLDSYEALQTFPELADFIAARYQPETRIGRFDVLLHCGPAGH